MGEITSVYKVQSKKSDHGPTKFDTVKRKAYLDLLASGGRRIASAIAVGVHIKTVERAIQADPDFAEAVSHAEMAANQKVEDALYQSALNGNVTAQQVWLYNRDPHRWRDARRVEHTGAGGGPIQTQELSARLAERLEPRELDDLEKMLMKLQYETNNN